MTGKTPQDSTEPGDDGVPGPSPEAPSDSGVAPAPHRPQQVRLRIAAISVAIISLVWGSWASTRAPRSAARSGAASAYMLALGSSRSAWVDARLPLGRADSPKRSADRSARDAYAALEALVRAAPEAGAVRRMVIMHRALGDGSWRACLVRFSAVRAPFDAAAEAAFWREALDEAPIPSPEAERLLAGLQSRGLGWFIHPARSIILRRAGMSRRATAAEADGARTVLAAGGINLLIVGATMIGLALLTLIGWHALRARRGVPLPAFLCPVPAPPLSQSVGDTLANVFLAFLAGSGVARLCMTLLLFTPARRALLGLPAPASAAVSALLTLVSLIPSALILRSALRRGEFRLADLGFRSEGFLREAAYGLGGYMAGLPLIAIAAAVSALALRHTSTPVPPVATEFIASRSALAQAILAFQAVVMAPIIEEWLLRGVLFRSLQSRMQSVAALLLASAIFAVLHPQLPQGFLAIFALGCVFNTLAVRRGSLLPSIVAHAVHNGVIFLSLALMVAD